VSPTNKRIRFIGIGAQKCASTWLHDVLAGHPQPALPSSAKEIDFFSYHYDFGFQWYERVFDRTEHTVLAGEVSPSYFHGEGVAGRVAKYNPKMRIILIVRDPISRAVSNHKHEVRIGHLRGPDRSFEFGLRNNPSYVEEGLYAKHFKKWLRWFSCNQILVMKFEDVVADADATLRQVCNFLNVDAEYTSNLTHTRSNESYLNRSRKFDQSKDAMRRAFRSLGLSRLWQVIGDSGLRDEYRRLNRVAPETAIAPPHPETLEELKALFRPEIEEFEQIAGIPTRDWLQQ
jgi:hypothetical protein